MQIILTLIGLYFLYRFIFGFLIPVIKTTRQVRTQFNAMKETMEGAYQQQQPRQESTTINRGQSSHSKPGKTTSGIPGAKEDYIEYEEVK